MVQLCLVNGGGVCLCTWDGFGCLRYLLAAVGL